MSLSLAGLLTGLLLALAAVAGGFTGFLLALVLGALGWVVGAALEGRVDLTTFTNGRRRG
ncbi:MULTISPECIES: hypothetical protein [Cellulomonas]|jgi:uncharacterized membrane protein|uniref:Membrane protein n=1 Tax=Cellulomonas iranensis TaxID=76862 RepID=A0ABU0GI83_9CELL|nr:MULTISPECIES: hypothetical protein [Cellulomonas]KSW14042.1 hypothetical protein ATM99_02875 [Cellulomonas sp. B6]MBO9568574.1 DUF2273 domain-containing protein [Cellulomonas iranensis]MDQ0425073.1 putative membrane protein [Cellulomonas iranensis]TFH71357.1 DUF2273 domain-containing protein [Cellulomonas sp. HD19AZ1]UCN14520.1 DUF2273 domain-containing protein [Cellulomonas iranensis]